MINFKIIKPGDKVEIQEGRGIHPVWSGQVGIVLQVSKEEALILVSGVKVNIPIRYVKKVG